MAGYQCSDGEDKIPGQTLRPEDFISKDVVPEEPQYSSAAAKMMVRFYSQIIYS